LSDGTISNESRIHDKKRRQETERGELAIRLRAYMVYTRKAKLTALYTGFALRMPNLAKLLLHGGWVVWEGTYPYLRGKQMHLRKTW
jgi:hypothetical protein